MCEQMNVFNAQGYVHLTDFLDKDNCAQLTAELKKLVAQGATTKDPQCPLSEAVHGAVVFDSLLEQLTPNFELASGKKLYPTYAYARLYRPGEELKIHTDRPACEISATLTLGFEGKPWPIFMGDEGGVNASEIVMGIGDAVLYRGCDKHHWRNKFEGEWQAQVFLHYVDAEGPHKDQKYDGRSCLSHQKPTKPDMTYFSIPDAMTADACKKLIESLEAQVQGEAAQIGIGTDGVVNKEIRNVKRVTLPSYRGIGATMAGMGMAANMQAWKFDVTHANQCDYLKYDKDGHYKAHVDTFMYPDAETRKLTVLAFLNDDFEGGKLFLQNGHEKIYPPQTLGSVLIFPSFLMHGVEPVTKGIRRSIVTWLVGPWFK